MTVKSEYYTDFEETMNKYDIPEEAAPFAAESLQSVEELLCGFMIYLISGVMSSQHYLK